MHRLTFFAIHIFEVGLWLLPPSPQHPSLISIFLVFSTSSFLLCCHHSCFCSLSTSLSYCMPVSKLDIKPDLYKSIRFILLCGWHEQDTLVVLNSVFKIKYFQESCQCLKQAISSWLACNHSHYCSAPNFSVIEVSEVAPWDSLSFFLDICNFFPFSSLFSWRWRLEVLPE